MHAVSSPLVFQLARLLCMHPAMSYMQAPRPMAVHTVAPAMARLITVPALAAMAMAETACMGQEAMDQAAMDQAACTVPEIMAVATAAVMEDRPHMDGHTVDHLCTVVATTAAAMEVMEAVAMVV